MNNANRRSSKVYKERDLQFLLIEMTTDQAASKALEWIFSEIEKAPFHLGNVEFLRHLTLALIDLDLSPDHPLLYRYLQTLSAIDETMNQHVAPQKCLVYSRLEREASCISNVAKKVDFEHETPDRLYISIVCTAISDFPEVFSKETISNAKNWLEKEIERNIREGNSDALSYNLASYYKLIERRDEKIERWLKTLEGLRVEDHWPSISTAWGDDLSVTASCIYNLVQMGVSPSSEVIRRAVAWHLRLAKLDGSWENNVRITVKIFRALVAASLDKDRTRETLMEILREHEAKQIMQELLAVIRASTIETQLKLQLVTEGQLALLQKGSPFRESVNGLASKIVGNADIVRLAPSIIDIATRVLSLLTGK